MTEEEAGCPIGAASPRFNEPRREEMVEPDDVAAMLRLKALGWGTRRIAAEIGVNRATVKRYVTAGGWQPFAAPARRGKLDGLDDWLRERLKRHRGNADVVRQELASELGIVASLRSVQRAVAPFRQELLAEARATVRFETAPGRQLQIDFGERLVEIAGRKVKAYLFVATLGYSRRVPPISPRTLRRRCRSCSDRSPSTRRSSGEAFRCRRKSPLPFSIRSTPC